MIIYIYIYIFFVLLLHIRHMTRTRNPRATDFIPHSEHDIGSTATRCASTERLLCECRSTTTRKLTGQQKLMTLTVTKCTTLSRARNMHSYNATTSHVQPWVLQTIEHTSTRKKTWKRATRKRRATEAGKEGRRRRRKKERGKEREAEKGRDGDRQTERQQAEKADKTDDEERKRERGAASTKRKKKRREGKRQERETNKNPFVAHADTYKQQKRTTLNAHHRIGL